MAAGGGRSRLGSPGRPEKPESVRNILRTPFVSRSLISFAFPLRAKQPRWAPSTSYWSVCDVDACWSILRWSILRWLLFTSAKLAHVSRSLLVASCLSHVTEHKLQYKCPAVYRFGFAAQNSLMGAS